MKKSFILYTDTLSIVDKLSDEEAGKLLKAIVAYQSDKSIEFDRITELIFEPFRVQFERDSAIYEKRCEQNRINGNQGGRPKTEKTHSVLEEPKKPKRFSENPKKPDNDNDSDSDSENDNGNDKIEIVAHATSPKEKFENEVRKIETTLPPEQVNKFLEYWTEKNPNGKMMRFQKEKTFDPNLRLKKWETNFREWSKEKRPANIKDFNI